MFGGLGLNGEGGEEGFMPMMQGMMKTLLSKEVLYPSLKEINDKVKHWKIVTKHIAYSQSNVSTGATILTIHVVLFCLETMICKI